MSGMMAGVMHAPLTAVFLIAEITGGYGLFFTLNNILNYCLYNHYVFEKHSIYHVRLAQRKELITHHKDKAVLTLIDMGKVIEKDFEVIHPNDKLRDLIDSIAKSKRNIFPVVDNKNLVGIVLLDDIRHVIFNSELYDQYLCARFNVLASCICGAPMKPMDEVMQKFEETNSWNLPVLKEGNT
jgi:CIC family chloride channel protein